MAYVPSYSAPFPVFQPAMRVITNITNSFPATVTTSLNHQYIVGTIVRLNVQPEFGMVQANQKVGTILTVPTPTTFTVSIDTTYFDVFVTPNIPAPPPQIAYQSPFVTAIGEDNSILDAAEQNVLPY